MPRLYWHPDGMTLVACHWLHPLFVEYVTSDMLFVEYVKSGMLFCRDEEKREW